MGHTETTVDLEAVSAAFNARVDQLGIPFAELARRADVDPTTLYALRNAENAPRARTLAKVSQALGWPADALERIGQGHPAPNDRTVEQRLDELEARIVAVTRLLEQALEDRQHRNGR
jgi:transcriptional regulator with XRE-family HTH domain